MRDKEKGKGASRVWRKREMKVRYFRDPDSNVDPVNLSSQNLSLSSRDMGTFPVIL